MKKITGFMYIDLFSIYCTMWIPFSCLRCLSIYLNIPLQGTHSYEFRIHVEILEVKIFHKKIFCSNAISLQWKCTLLTVSNNRKKILVILISHQTLCCLIFSFMIITRIVINAKLLLISIYENVNKYKTLNVYWIFCSKQSTILWWFYYCCKAHHFLVKCLLL